MSVEEQYNDATLREFHGELIVGEIELALGLYEESITELAVATQKIDQLLQIVRTNESLPEFDAALAQQFVDVDVNGLPRISQDTRQIVTIEDFLLVKKSELATLRQFTEEAIQATRDIQEEIDQGLFVATLLGGPNLLKRVKTDLGFGRLTVSNLFFTGAKGTGLAVGDIFPLGFEFLLPPSVGGIVVPFDDSEFAASQSASSSGSSAPLYAALAGAAAAAVALVTAGGWYARRRWLR